MADVTINEKLMETLEKAHYLLGYLAKLHDESARDGIYTVPITIRKDDKSKFVVEVQGQSIVFDAE